MDARAPERLAVDRRIRALWCAVLVQAYADLETEPLGSVPYRDAAAWFFGSSPETRRDRQTVADLLGMLPEAFDPPARAIANRRRAEAGLEPLAEGNGWPRDVPLPRLVATWQAPPPPPPPRRGGHPIWRRDVFRPQHGAIFDPWVRLPSEIEVTD